MVNITPWIFTKIYSDKFNILNREVERMKNIERLYIQVVVWLVCLVGLIGCLQRRADTAVTLAPRDAQVIPCQTDPAVAGAVLQTHLSLID